MFAIHEGENRESGRRRRYRAPSADSDIHWIMKDNAPNSTQRLLLCSGAKARMIASPSPARTVQVTAGAFQSMSSGVMGNFSGIGRGKGLGCGPLVVPEDRSSPEALISLVVWPSLRA